MEGWGSEDGRAIGNLMDITKPLDKILQTQKQTFTDKQFNLGSNCRRASDSLTGIALQHLFTYFLLPPPSASLSAQRGHVFLSDVLSQTPAHSKPADHLLHQQIHLNLATTGQIP